MNTVIEAVFDGAVFRPVEPLKLKPNIRVRIIIETVQPTAISSFLRTARSLTLDGPSDLIIIDDRLNTLNCGTKNFPAFPIYCRDGLQPVSTEKSM